MRVTLMHMPWAAVEVPSLALGIMAAATRRRDHDVEVRYANLDFVDWAVGQRGLSPVEYRYFSEGSFLQGAGDWVFASALWEEELPFEPMSRLLADAGYGAAEIALTSEMHGIVPQFIAGLAEDLADDAPDVVGFTTTFQQNTASLAVAKLLKRRCPGIRTVFGGANCEGPQGAALHRNFPFLDYVVRGEGEVVFPMLLDAVGAGATDLSGITGLCWRDATGVSRENPMSHRPLPPGDTPGPDYGGFFERLDASAAAGWLAPRLVVEGSRGCWWGEKHHCTFCGLNGSLMRFRSKSPDRFLAEVLDLARRHQLLDFMVVDNILDMSYFDTVLRRLAESDLDVRLYFEVKSNLRRHHFQQLADAGAVQVQPGIENLSSHVLQLMNKGVTGCQNVRCLRDAQSAGVTTSWNYLCGFPGETDEDYTSILRQLPMLHHLDPPSGVARIAIERFSPYFNRPEMGFADLQPSPQYAETYRLPEAELADLAYLFTAAPQGIDITLAAALDEAVAAWQAEFPHSRLTYSDLGDRIVIVSQRTAYDWSVLELADESEIEVFRLLSQPRAAATLAQRMPGGDAALTTLLERWAALGIVFHDGGSYVHTAPEANNQMLARIDHHHQAAMAAMAANPAGTAERTEGQRHALVLG